MTGGTTTALSTPTIDAVLEPSRLAELFERTDNLAVACHADPDPDAIASAMGLCELAERFGVKETAILYDGTISHQENRAMVKLLDVDLFRPEKIDFGAVDTVTLVDHSTPDERSPVPEFIDPEIVFDHHENADVEGGYVIQAREFGATATIVGLHFAELREAPTERTATALYFAIHRETLGFTRGTTSTEHQICAYLSALVDYGVIDRLLGSRLTAETADGIGTAIDARQVRGSCLVSTTGQCGERDAIPQAADYLLQVGGITTTVVYGLVDETIHLSARTENPLLDIGEVLERAFDDVGSVGGHSHMAGGQIPLGIFADTDFASVEHREFLVTAVQNRVFEALSEWTDNE